MKLFPFEKNGICTKHGIKKYREKFMQDGNNHLFGKAYGKEIGVSYNRYFSNRNNNVLVVGGAGTGKTYNYIESNLLQENHSVVVTDDNGVLYAKYGDYLRKKGYNVYCIDFNNPEESCRYNPFLHEAYESRENTIEKFANDFVVACKENAKVLPPYEQAVYFALLKVMFYYVFYSPALSEEQRSFEYVQAIVKELQTHGRKMLNEYDCYNLFEKELNLLETVSDETFHRVIVSASVDLNDFVITRSDNSRETVFVEKENTTNFSIEEFSSKQSYLFITHSDKFDARVGFLIAQIIAMLFTYSNKFWEKNDTEYPRRTQFYLDNFYWLNIGDFITSIAVSKKHGFSFSILVRTMEEFINKYKDDDEWRSVLENTDVQIFTGNTSKCIHNEMIKTIGELTFINGERMKYGSFKTQEGVISKEPILSVEKIKNIFAENKIIVVIRDCYPMICERLNPVDYKKQINEEVSL